ncbi:thioredoxin-like protein [Coemansia reversa NRRL 1564]|uniref:Thioredoxin-like protein n=1 Tax=Coemansia reversa (strain ATCC 12441 / NRRL 1564) TaxID=763665 RepID=A0A2G5BA16_COERN|nr:thioredoxin-like protein [Coemansia reversa NRRL 1564]|eukprot:PIA15854.1 thioredoxin-like protein [Coemansia reversa NRRL 1564]
MRLATLVLGLGSLVSGYTILDTENFDTHVQSGLWLIKYYSPTCPWSRRFAPVWERVYQSLEDDLVASDVHLGEVDCKANPALCVAASIDGYPTVVYYNQGVNQGEVPGGQSYENLANYAITL